MRFGITSDLVRLRTMEPGEAAEVARAVVHHVHGLDERSVLALLTQFSQGQILAFDSKNKLIGWALHLRVNAKALASLRPVATSLLAIHVPEGALLMPFVTGTPRGRAGVDLRDAFDVARRALSTALRLEQAPSRDASRTTRVA